MCSIWIWQFFLIVVAWQGLLWNSPCGSIRTKYISTQDIEDVFLWLRRWQCWKGVFVRLETSGKALYIHRADLSNFFLAESFTNYGYAIFPLLGSWCFSVFLWVSMRYAFCGSGFLSELRNFGKNFPMPGFHVTPRPLLQWKPSGRNEAENFEAFLVIIPTCILFIGKSTVGGPRLDCYHSDHPIQFSVFKQKCGKLFMNTILIISQLWSPFFSLHCNQLW